MNNYELSRDRAQKYFLGFDQESIIRTWELDADSQWMYMDFFGRSYRICRKTGSIYRCWDDSQAEFSEVLSIFDLLCHACDEKFVSGSYAPVNSLKNRPKAQGVGSVFDTRFAAVFDRDPEGFRQACEDFSGVPVPMGDLGFRFPVFGPLHVILKFYHADEDFPASVTLLWDDETLRYVYYETVFYMAGFLLDSLSKAMTE